MDGPGSTRKRDEVRKLAGTESWVASFLPQLKPFVKQLWASIFKQSTGNKINLVYKRQVWPALSWLGMFHEHQRGDLVRHLFLVDQTLDGLVWRSTPARLEVERHVGMAIEADRVASRAFVSIEWTTEDKSLLFTKRDPAHQATWEAFMALLAIRHFVTPKTRGRIILVGDALGGTVGIHVWSEVNVLEDALSRIGNRTTVPKGLRHARRETLRSWGPPDRVCLGTLQDIM